MQRIVAIQLLNDSAVRLYRRGERAAATSPAAQTTVTFTDAEFYPFFFLSSPSLIEGFSRKFWLKELAGSNFFRFLVAFQRWTDLWEGVRFVLQTFNHTALKRATHYSEIEPLLLKLDPLTQYLLQSGVTLFKNMSYDELRRVQIRIATHAKAGKRTDLRVTLELTEVTDAVADVAFKVFSGPATSGGRVAALRIPGGASLTRGEIDGYTEFVKIYGAKGLAYIKVNDASKLNEEGLQSPIVKNLHEASLKAIVERTGAQSGELIFFGADKTKVVNDALGALRIKLGHEKGYLNGKAWEPLWVVDFPMFEYDEDEKRWNACHHPFTAPRQDQQAAFVAADPGDDQTIESIVSAGYDLVANGSEIGGGSTRIHTPAVQSKVFQLLGLSPEQAQEKFSFPLEALKFGAPPHGGIAFGLDRLVMHLCGTACWPRIWSAWGSPG